MALNNVRHFSFNWHENEKYREPIERTNLIMATDVKSATYAFRKAFGSLKKNTINYIQEVDPTGKGPIGDRIIPTKDEELA